MKVIINGRFLLHRVTGVERYAREIINNLDEIITPNEIEMAVPAKVKDIPAYKNIRVVKVGNFRNRIWEQVSFPAYVLMKKGISLNLCNVAPLLAPGIVCIHDVKIKARSGDFSKKFLLWYNLLFINETKRAKAIITVSEFSKHEICKYYNVNADRVSVIPNAWQHFERIVYDENTLSKYGLEKNQYFFSMCSLEPNKNFKWVAEIAQRSPDIIFVVAGSINKRVFADGIGFQCPRNMKLLGYITDEEAKTLMRDCKAFLFPTFYEGFGIPPLEAICAGANQVVVSDNDVMHEIFGENVIYIDPTLYTIKIQDILMKRCNNKEVLKRFSWKKSGELLYQLLQTVREYE